MTSLVGYIFQYQQQASHFQCGEKNIFLSQTLSFTLTMLACQRIAATLIAKRSFHTAPVALADSEGLFGIRNPWAKKHQQPEQPEVTPAQHTSQDTPQVTFNVKYQDAEVVS